MAGGAIWEWSVDAEWTTTAAPGTSQASPGGSDPTLPPWLRPARIRFGSIAYKRPAIKSITDQPIRNAAGDPIVIEKDRATLEITISKSLTYFSYLWCQEVPYGFRFSRNANPFTPTGIYGPLFGTAPIPVGKARCENLTASVAGDGTYVDAEMVVSLDEDDHASIFEQLGFFYLPAAGAPAAQKRRFMDGAGFATDPRPLNADGTARATNLEPVTGSFQLYGLEDWDIIGMLP